LDTAVSISPGSQLSYHSQRRPDDCAERSISFDNCLSHSVIPINNHDGERQLK